MQAEQKAKKKKKTAGFTLVEMMIVVTIIGVIMGLVGVNVVKKLDESRVETTKIQIRQLLTVLADFRRVCGFYPTQDQGLDALIKTPSGRECKNYPGEGFLSSKKLPQDGWKNEFLFNSDGNKVQILSYGSDGVEGGEGFAKDINSDEME